MEVLLVFSRQTVGTPRSPSYFNDRSRSWRQIDYTLSDPSVHLFVSDVQTRVSGLPVICRGRPSSCVRVSSAVPCNKMLTTNN